MPGLTRPALTSPPQRYPGRQAGTVGALRVSSGFWFCEGRMPEPGQDARFPERLDRSETGDLGGKSHIRTIGSTQPEMRSLFGVLDRSYAVDGTRSVFFHHKCGHIAQKGFTDGTSESANVIHYAK